MNFTGYDFICKLDSVIKYMIAFVGAICPTIDVNTTEWCRIFVFVLATVAALRWYVWFIIMSSPVKSNIVIHFKPIWYRDVVILVSETLLWR